MAPYDHRVNAAEIVIQTFKNHTISGLCICDEKFPSILWCKSIKNIQDTINMLRTLKVHPKLSAFHVLEIQHEFNIVPFGPPGTRKKPFSIHQRQDDPMDQEHWTAGTLAFIFKSHQLAATKHHPITNLVSEP